VTIPVYATVALSENILHVPALKNAIIHSFSNRIASHRELAGAYLVFEQTEPSNTFAIQKTRSWHSWCSRMTFVAALAKES
jgi:hypothetical protein